MTARIDISIGPVQGFIAQARRTRDLWGGSFLLSFLAARAMDGARKAGATVVQPHVEGDALLEWASGKRNGSPPKIGTITNHFAVETNGSPREVANAARNSFNGAWREACAAVWDRYVSHAVSASDGAEAIWNRQIENFWEFSWTAGDPDERSQPLARRKHWRSHRPSDEPGDKCTVMSDFQELSGYVRATDSAKQDAFWERIGDQTGDLDIRDDKERLCAIALVKRLFPSVAKRAVGWEPDMSGWPSTLDMGESSFYALLFADGDKLGKLIAEMEGDDAIRKVSESVARFVKKVPEIVKREDCVGVTIYAGGEDVLIMLPADKAIECAQAISCEYRAAFSEHIDRATASAAVVFAHQSGVSLRAALEEGRRLLDDVAKDGNGRDSLAVSVLKPSGRYCEWTSSWNRGDDQDDETGKRAAASLRRLKKAIYQDGDAPGLSSSLIYRIRDLLASLCDWDRWTPGALFAIPPGLDMERVERLLEAEILHSLQGRMRGDEDARAKRAKELTASVANLLNPSRKIEPADGGAPVASIGKNEVGIDALMLARFLSDPDEMETRT